MEIVTEPDMRCGVEAASFVRELQLLLQTIRSCDGNMQDGSLRVDANVSVSPEGSADLGTPAEVKNVNGLRFLSRAIGELRSYVITCVGEGKGSETLCVFNCTILQPHTHLRFTAV